MSHDKVLSLLEAASSALAEATHIMKDSLLPLPPSPPSPISQSASSMTEVDEGYFFDEGLYDADGKVLASPGPRVQVLASPGPRVQDDLKKIWNVPGDELGELGHLAKVAVTTASYGISIGRNSGATEDVLGPLGYCVVDKEKWSLAKDISVGDIFYMADFTDGKVYRGIVTAHPVAGPFCPIRSLENSFTACLGLVSDYELRSEVELVFKVDWKEFDQYDQDWCDFLELIGTGLCRLPDE
jgi:hypothetical protein